MSTSTAPIFLTKGQLSSEGGLPQGDPEALTWQIASLRRRAPAWLLDSTITTIIAALLLGPVYVARGGALFSDRPGFMGYTDEAATTSELLFGALDWFVIYAVWVVYLAVMCGRGGIGNGRTLGRMATGIRLAARDGGPVSKGLAWRRALWSGALFGLPYIVGSLLDAALDSPPTATFAGEIGLAVAIVVAIVVALNGGTRRALHDRLAGTVVVEFRAAGAPLTSETPTTDAGPPPAPLVPRRRGPSTFALAALAIVLAVALGASRLVVDGLPGPEQGEVKPPDGEAAAAQQRVVALAKLGQACLRRGNSTSSCTTQSALRADAFDYDDSVDDEFDLDGVEGIGTRAGMVGSAAFDEDMLYLFAFTSKDQVWTVVLEKDGDEYVRICMDHDAEVCAGLPEEW